jgi:GMP synthase-like glutamine amidotransferase
MRVRYLEHAAFEGLGEIGKYFEYHHDEIAGTRLFDGDTLPSHDDYDLLVIMGGPMSAYDTDETVPWFSKEKAFIYEAIERKKKVLGVCLGAQLIAYVLGAKVYPNAQKEIGWFPIEPGSDAAASPYATVFSRAFTTFHWHGDTFDLPAGAKHLAMNAVTKHQAFSVGEHVLALQFHPEVTKDMIVLFSKGCGARLKDRGSVQSMETMLGKADHLALNSLRLFQILDIFCGRVESYFDGA